MSIPSSPIAQKQPKIGTRYIAVNRTFYFGCYGAGHAHASMDKAKVPFVIAGGYDIYTLLDPADAAELERLRKVEDEAAKVILQFLSADISPSNAAVTSWRNHFYARIAFEKKIGGGV